MIRLTGFELEKIWGKKRFLLSCLILLALDVFLLWYTSLPGEDRAGLSAYRVFQEEISDMSEPEKGAYIIGLKETLDGVGFVQEVLMFQGMADEMGEALAAQALESAPGVFEAYYDMYQSGDYLKLTDSLWKEQSLIEELYEEWEKSADYGEYLKSVREAENRLGGIGIFGGGGQDSFSARNVKKSAGDYAGLSDEKIRWMPGRALTGAMENVWTDIFLLLSVFLFVGSLIVEEKEKGLFYITRSTMQGMGKSIGAKLASLFVHCMGMAALLYGANLLFFRITVGFGDFGASVQSVAAWRESCLSVSIRGYLALSVITKGVVLFGFGMLLTALCIGAETVALPYGAGLLFCGVGGILYAAVPAASRWNLLKYLNLTGILKTEHIYGAYLNFDIFEYPVSCMTLSWITIDILTGAGACGSIFLYIKGEKLTFRDRKGLPFSFFRPHGSLLRHECYKIMIADRAAFVLLVFGLLTGYQEWEHSWHMTAQERYYQDIMLRLEGELTDEKEELVLAEQARYQEAFDRISEIERMVADGEIKEETGDEWKAKYQAVTAFYPSFMRVWQQYRHICEEGGNFIYDTGWLSLFGVTGGGFLVNLLMLVCGVVLAFGNAAAMEDTAGAWNLLGSTRKGRGKVLLCKSILCGGAAALLSLVPTVCRGICVSRVFPLRGLKVSVGNIPCLREGFADMGFGWGKTLMASLPVWGFALLFVLSQAAVLAGAALLVFALSVWRREALGTYFLAALILAVPLVLTLLGFSFAENFSLYPFYAWTKEVLENNF